MLQAAAFGGSRHEERLKSVNFSFLSSSTWCPAWCMWNECIDAGSWAWCHIYSMQTQIAQFWWSAFCPALLRPAPVLKGCLPGPMDCLLESVGSMKHSRALLHSITWCIMLTALMRCLFKGRWDTQLVWKSTCHQRLLQSTFVFLVCKRLLQKKSACPSWQLHCIMLVVCFLASLHHMYIVDTNILCLRNCDQACFFPLDWHNVYLMQLWIAAWHSLVNQIFLLCRYLSQFYLMGFTQMQKECLISPAVYLQPFQDTYDLIQRLDVEQPIRQQIGRFAA